MGQLSWSDTQLPAEWFSSCWKLSFWDSIVSLTLFALTWAQVIMPVRYLLTASMNYRQGTAVNVSINQVVTHTWTKKSLYSYSHE